MLSRIVCDIARLRFMEPSVGDANIAACMRPRVCRGGVSPPGRCGVGADKGRGNPAPGTEQSRCKDQ